MSLNIFLKLFAQHSNLTKHHMNRSPIINELVNFIDKNIENIDLSLEMIAKEFNYSKEHIIRVFKNELGLTPHKYIINKRVHKGKNLLISNHSQNIAHIAVETGFYDQSHFSKTFKTIFAISPNQIKK